ncbi:hypothetical protein AXF11_01550 [Leptotrichia sp. oral taxon 847]|nr:hypothetical protein AXF11_01550 [Leptotrichia sp. oral taxon 847]
MKFFSLKGILVGVLMTNFFAFSSVFDYKRENSKKINEISDSKKQENRLSALFKAIRQHNNNFVKFSLLTKENLDKRKEMNEQNNPGNGKYGVAIDFLQLYGMDNNTLIDVNSKDERGYTPIVVAIESQNNEILEYLIKNGANLREKHPLFGRSVLNVACYYENKEAVEMLLSANPKLINEQSGTDGWTALQDATLKANIDIIKFLLKKGANPQLKDYSGGTALDMATEFGKGQIVKLFRDNIKANRGY